MHSAGLELTKLTYTRLEDNLIRHRGDRLMYIKARLRIIKIRVAQAYQLLGGQLSKVGVSCFMFSKHARNIFF